MRLRRIAAAGTGVVLVFAVPAGTAQETAPAAPRCIFAAAGEGWGVLSADQERPFFEAPLPVDAAVPHAMSEITNQSAVSRAFIADPGVVGRATVEAPRPIGPAGSPIYTVPQPVFPAAVSAAQPGGDRQATFGVGGAYDPTGQFAFSAGRAEAEAVEQPPTTKAAARFASLAFYPGANAAEAEPPEDADSGPVQRGLVTIAEVATRTLAAYDAESGRVRGLASTSLSEIEIAGVVRIRSLETLAETITDGEAAERDAVARVSGFAIGGTEVPFNAGTLDAANQLLRPLGFELVAAQGTETSEGGEEVVVSRGLQLRGEHVDSSGERRRVNLILGYAKAGSKCLPSPELPAADLGGLDGAVALPPGDVLAGDATGPVPAAPDIPAGSVSTGDTGAPPAGAVATAPASYSVRWDWSKFRIRFWPLGDIFTLVGSFAPFALAGALAWQRRRLRGLLG